MTTQISGTTGCSQVQVGSIYQDDLAANVVGKGPAFSVKRTANQTGGASGVAAKVQLNVEDFDTSSAFDNTVNYRFQPTVAGYYQITFSAALTGSSMSYAGAQLHKNGTLYRSGSWVQNGGDAASVGAALVYLNGTTDYLELFAIALVASGNVMILCTGSNPTFMDGYLVRAA